MIIGVSGKTGTGKSHVVKYLKKKIGFKVIDTDKIKYQIIDTTPKIIEELVRTFGKRILHPNKKINRIKLNSVIYKDPLALNAFHQIINASISKQVVTILREQEDNYIIDSSFPHLLKLANLFDVSVLVTTSKRAQIKRMSKFYSSDILNNMWKFQKDTRNYDYVIENQTTITDLRNDVDELIKEMFKSNQTK